MFFDWIENDETRDKTWEAQKRDIKRAAILYRQQTTHKKMIIRKKILFFNNNGEKKELILKMVNNQPKQKSILLWSPGLFIYNYIFCY